MLLSPAARPCGARSRRDGLKLDSQVAQLVSAMASFSSANPGFDPTTATQVPNDPALQGVVAAAWHA